MKNRNSIGALILSKNNNSTITATINSVINICSQVVVLDTGSTDETPSTASKSGAEVYFYYWVDDFSKARNEALKYLQTDWILMIDSDEILNDFDKNKFDRIVSNSEIGGINVIIDNAIKDENNDTVTSHRYTRLFINNPNVRFSGRIHEQIRESIINSGYEIVESDFKILHLGYSKFSPNKYERNQTLIEKDIIDNPDDDWLKYHLAGTHFAAGNDEEAVNIFSQIINSPQLSTEQNEIIRLRLAQLSLKCDNYDAVVKLTDFRSNYEQNEALRCYVLGTTQLLLNNVSAAYYNLKKCLEIDSPSLNQNEIERAFKIAEKMLYS
jgi:glycosyltransferase involved in cell wall biosynthesis